MTREIKFRVWHNPSKTFLTKDGGCFKSSSYIYATGSILNGDFEDLTVQQFTGIKDKNGKDIYEGDILAWINSGDGSSVKVSIKYGQIFFDNSPAVWALGCVFGTDHYNEYGLPKQLKELKIIGNIFEHPELIKK